MSTTITPSESPELQTWSSGIAPAYIGTFLWVAFLDRLGLRALPVGGLLPALLGVGVASTLAYLLLYRTPARWGFSARRPLDEVATSTFGIWGTLAVPNLILAFGQVAIFAIGIGYATGWMLDGLRILGLLDARVVRPVFWGGTSVPSPLFLTSALVWGVVTALVGMKIVRWIAAIMQYFPVFPAVGLALVVAGTLSGLGDFVPSRIDPRTNSAIATIVGWRLGFLTTFQWTFAFAALLGITGADWGSACRTALDVSRGGLISLAVAPMIVASLALLAIAGADGKRHAMAPSVIGSNERGQGLALSVGSAETDVNVSMFANSDRVAIESPFTLRSAIEGGLDRRFAGTILIIFGLASLAPACYAAFEFGRRLHRIAPGVSKLGWTLIGVASAWFLIVGGWHQRTGSIFTILGAIYAPVAGAMVADASRQGRPDWGGSRPGINLAGFFAWVAGAAVGLAPLAARIMGWSQLAELAPAALFAFLTAFAVYRIAAQSGLEPKIVAATDLSLED